MWKDTSIPQPGDWEWAHAFGVAEAPSDRPAAPQVDDVPNPVVARLLDHRGQVMSQWRARPPVGFRR